MICEGLRRDPTTSLLTALIGAWMGWYGLTLLTFPVTPVRQAGFAGPIELFGLRVWGAIFVVGAAAQFVRLVVLRWHRIAVALNFVPTAITVGWAFAWFVGPYSTAQATYTFIAAITLIHPHMRGIAERYYTVTYRG